jgi:hypothetical protein
LIWLRIGTGGGSLWMRWWTFGFHKIRGVSWLAEDLLAFQEAHCCMELVRQAIRDKILGSDFDYLTAIIHVVSKNFLSNCLRRIILSNVFKVLYSSRYTFQAFYIFYTIYRVFHDFRS